jgi:hypothetical protein
MNRGAAILSVIDSIENMGTSIELAVTNTSRSQGVYIQTQTLVKRSGEHIDFDAIAFASAHPSMFRRIGFATWERVVEDGCEDKFKWAYGQSCDCQLLEMDQIYVPSFEGCGISQNVINKGGVPLYEAVLKGFNFLQDGLTFTGKTITETTYDYHE